MLISQGEGQSKSKSALPTVNWSAPPSAVREPASSDPKIGPVHEKDTMAKVSAIKNIPNIHDQLKPHQIDSPNCLVRSIVVSKKEKAKIQIQQKRLCSPKYL